MVRILFCLTNILAFGNLCFMKRIMFTLFVVLLLSLQSSTSLASSSLSWEKVSVLRVLDNQHLQLTDSRVVRILGMTPPSLFEKQDPQHCYAKPFFRLLKLLVEDKEIKIRADGTLPDGNILPRHVKLKNGQNLAEFLLEKGKTSVMTMSNKASFYSKYLKAQLMAKESEIGIWKGCGGNNELHERMRESGLALHNTARASFLAPISVGRVKEVLSGNHFLLDNGLRVKMLGIEIPSSNDVRKGFSCFGLQAKQQLESFILHQKVFLRRDNSQLDKDGNLLRSVFLPLHDKRGQEVFINELMVLNGYAKYSKSEVDTKYEKILFQAQKVAYQEKKGAWKSCLQFILAGK